MLTPQSFQRHRVEVCDNFLIFWVKVYDNVLKNGGDGFYGGLSIPYEEPVMSKYNYIKGECPNAEKVQPKMMQFKCNYRNLDEAKSKIDILKKSLSYR